MENLFKNHIAHLQKNAEQSLAKIGGPGVILAAGSPVMKFEDDMPYPFVVNHHFRHWCPAKGPEHALVVRPGKKPLLLAYQPEDYWHAVEKVGENTFWSAAFEIYAFTKTEMLWQYVKQNFAGFALHGSLPFQPEFIGLVKIPSRLLAHFDWERAYKTAFEIACLTEATRLGAAGHLAARQAFLAGESEFEIHLEFLRATGLVEDELPYTPIIGLNANAAVLHYHWKDTRLKNADVLLIDAGAQFNDYASDITRTHTHAKTNSVFVSLLKEMESAQQRLCGLLKPGLTNRDLNYESRREVSQILLSHGLLQGLSLEAVLNENLVFDFYPHGIGHPLGIHVHDVGGYQMDKEGARMNRTEADGALRSLRTFGPDNCQTVEPGLYFIDLLLERRRQTPLAKHYNWKLIDELKPCGGIRIEDNVLVTESGHRNLTREHLSDLKLTS